MWMLSRFCRAYSDTVGGVYFEGLFRRAAAAMMLHGVNNALAMPERQDNEVPDFDDFVRDLNSRLRQSGRESGIGSIAPNHDHQV